MKKRLIHWLLPLIAILAITTVMVLSISLNLAHATPITTHSAAPASVWRG